MQYNISKEHKQHIARLFKISRVLALLIAIEFIMIISMITYLVVTKDNLSTPEVVQEDIKIEEIIVEEVPEVDPVLHYTSGDVNLLARTIYNESRGLSDTEKACVAWVVLNRVDAGYGSIKDVITSPNQFSYSADPTVPLEYTELAQDVLDRWNAEKNGQTEVGRVIPSDYLYFHGDWSTNPGNHQNYFRREYAHTGDYWDYSLDSPYES